MAGDPESFAMEAWKFFSVSEQDDPYLTDSDVLDDVERKDGQPFDLEDEAALLPYNGFVCLATVVADAMADLTSLDDDDGGQSVLNLAGRKDGTPFDDEDENALLPYGGLLGAAALLSALLENKHDFFDVLNGVDTTDHEEAGVGAASKSLFAGLARRDGLPFDEHDDAALLELGGVAVLIRALGNVPLVGDLDAPVTGDAAAVPSGTAATLCSLCVPRDPFEGLTRADGAPFDADDEAALLPFAPLLYLNTMIDGCSEELDRGIGLFPDEDPNLTTVGESWGEQQAELESSWMLGRKDGRAMDGDDEDALAVYGAWTVAGALLLAVYRKTFGSLKDLRTSSSAPSKEGMEGGLKRRPSGAELSAYIGLATQKTLGLHDPTRKVRTRGIL